MWEGSSGGWAAEEPQLPTLSDKRSRHFAAGLSHAAQLVAPPTPGQPTCSWQMPAETSCHSIAFTPAATAEPHSPPRMPALPVERRVGVRGWAGSREIRATCMQAGLPFCPPSCCQGAQHTAAPHHHRPSSQSLYTSECCNATLRHSVHPPPLFLAKPRSPPCAKCAATREDEQAVSMPTHGPCGSGQGRMHRLVNTNGCTADGPLAPGWEHEPLLHCGPASKQPQQRHRNHSLRAPCSSVPPPGPPTLRSKAYATRPPW